MKIGMVLEHSYPPDARVTKEAMALSSGGHDIHLLCRAKGSGQPLFEEDTYLKIHRFPYSPTKWMGGRSLQYVLTFHDNQWLKAISDFVEQNAIDVLHVHDVPLAKIALQIKQEIGVPVVIDMHEFFSEGLRTWYESDYFDIKSRIWNFIKTKIVRNPHRFAKMETSALQNCDHIIAVIEEAKERFIEKKNLPTDKISVVMNTIELEQFNALPINEKIVNRYKDKFMIFYVGGIGHHRGLETSIEGIREIVEKIPNARLVIAGDGQSKTTLENLAAKLDVSALVEFPGWVDYIHIRSYILASKICIVPHLKSSHTDNTIPHKLFQYMSQNRPVVVSNTAPLKRIVEEVKCGIVFRSGKSKEFAKACIKLRDENVAKKMGDAGMKACETKYNWDSEANRLRHVYSRLL